jgi:hypothetical protein
MYLLIPDVVLTSRKLSSDEKILLSYMLTLENAGKRMFAKTEYLDNLLGLFNTDDIIEELGAKGYITSSQGGKQPSPWVMKAMKARGNT